MEFWSFCAVDVVKNCISKKLCLAAALLIEQIDHRFVLGITNVEADRKLAGIFFFGHGITAHRAEAGKDIRNLWHWR